MSNVVSSPLQQFIFDQKGHIRFKIVNHDISIYKNEDFYMYEKKRQKFDSVLILEKH